MAESAPIVYRREMGFTPAEFFRLLPSAMGAHPWVREGNSVRASVYDGQLTMVIGEERERRIALLRLPYVEVDFEFHEVSREQHDAFRRHFDLRYQRGGG